MTDDSVTTQQAEEAPADSTATWALLLDPEWEASSPDEAPPNDAMVGGWLLDPAGVPGRFQPNPDYQPAAEDAVTDPTDAVLRLLTRGEAEPDALIPTLRDSFVELAVSEDGQLLVGPAPDGASCVAVVTAGAQRRRAPFGHWRQVTVDQLMDMLPDGVDILLNPAGEVPFRVVSETLRASIAEDPGNEQARQPRDGGE